MRFMKDCVPPAGFLAALLGLLGGCAGMPLTSMARLAATDFATVDPAELRVAVKLPAGVRPQPRSVRLRMTMTVAGNKDEQDFVLADLADAGELGALQAEATGGAAVFAYRLDPADVPRLAALRADLDARKRQGKHGSLVLSVAAEACRTGPLPPHVLLTTFLKTEPAGDFIPLARDIDLAKAAGVDIAAKIPPCR